MKSSYLNGMKIVENLHVDFSIFLKSSPIRKFAKKKFKIVYYKFLRNSIIDLDD